MPTLNVSGREVEMRREWWHTSGANRCAWACDVAELSVRGPLVLVRMRQKDVPFADFSDAHRDMVTILAAVIGEDRPSLQRAALQEPNR